MCYPLFLTYHRSKTMTGLAKTSVLLLLDEINRNNRNSIAITDVVFGVPVKTTENGRNTRVRVESAVGGNYSESRDIWYNRLDIASLFAQMSDIHIDIDSTQVISYLDVLHGLNTKYKLNIQDDEILPAEIFSNRMLMTMAPSSLAFTGEVNIVLSIDGDRPLYEIITNTSLDGLWYPEAIIHHLTYPEIFTDATMLSLAVKPNGDLKFGIAQSATHMVIATNNELEVAVRAGIIGKPQTEAVGGELVLEVDPGQKIEFVFSIALLNTAIDNRLEELYDISFYLNCIDTPATFIATLVKDDGGVFRFITDDKTAEVNNIQQFNNGRVLQTVQSIENFPTILDGGIAGTYEIGLVAYRKQSIVPRLEAVYNFKVIVRGQLV
jgi:hypothetical protein